MYEVSRSLGLILINLFSERLWGIPLLSPKIWQERQRRLSPCGDRVDTKAARIHFTGPPLKSEWQFPQD